jgi:hypothetical protein
MTLRAGSFRHGIQGEHPMMNNVEEPENNEELQLWEASQNYMRGQITVGELEQVERENAHHLNKAIMRFALLKSSEARPARNISNDDKERYLWMISRRYMAGDLTVEQLEENEFFYTQRFEHAILSLAFWKLRRALLAILQRKPGRTHSSVQG